MARCRPGRPLPLRISPPVAPEHLLSTAPSTACQELVTDYNQRQLLSGRGGVGRLHSGGCLHRLMTMFLFLLLLLFLLDLKRFMVSIHML